MEDAAPPPSPHDADPPPYESADILPPPDQSPPPLQRVPPKAGVFGMWLFLAALGMLFAASMLGYVIIRVQQTRELVHPTTQAVTPATAPLHSLHLPFGLWFSTLVILASSVTMHFALQNVRRERQAKFRNWLIVTLILSGLFLVVQTPSLATLLIEHNQATTSHTLLGFIFFLVIIHALHLVGGILPLAVVTRNAHLGAYDHESHNPVRYTTMYWHFLDAVWIVMFAVLLLTR